MVYKINPAYFVSIEEANYRLLSLQNGLDATKINGRCTSCDSQAISFDRGVMKGPLYTHPLLKTIICKKCYHFYEDDDWSVDEDGSDKYCRWCGLGGELFMCSQCPSGFCRKCITRNFTAQQQIKVEADGWICVSCNVQPLIELRTHCWAAQQMIRAMKAEKQHKTNKLKTDTTANEASCLPHEIRTTKEYQNESKEKTSFQAMRTENSPESHMSILCETTAPEGSSLPNMTTIEKELEKESGRVALLSEATSTENSPESHMSIICETTTPEGSSLQNMTTIEKELEKESGRVALLSEAMSTENSPESHMSIICETTAPEGSSLQNMTTIEKELEKESERVALLSEAMSTENSPESHMSILCETTTPEGSSLQNMTTIEKELEKESERVALLSEAMSTENSPESHMSILCETTAPEGSSLQNMTTIEKELEKESERVALLSEIQLPDADLFSSNNLEYDVSEFTNALNEPWFEKVNTYHEVAASVNEDDLLQNSLDYSYGTMSPAGLLPISFDSQHSSNSLIENVRFSESEYSMSNIIRTQKDLWDKSKGDPVLSQIQLPDADLFSSNNLEYDVSEFTNALNEPWFEKVNTYHEVAASVNEDDLLPISFDSQHSSNSLIENVRFSESEYSMSKSTKILKSDTPTSKESDIIRTQKDLWDKSKGDPVLSQKAEKNAPFINFAIRTPSGKSKAIKGKVIWIQKPQPGTIYLPESTKASFITDEIRTERVFSKENKDKSISSIQQNSSCQKRKRTNDTPSAVPVITISDSEDEVLSKSSLHLVPQNLKPLHQPNTIRQQKKNLSCYTIDNEEQQHTPSSKIQVKRSYPEPEVFEDRNMNKHVRFEKELTIHNYPGDPDIEQGPFSVTNSLTEGVRIVSHFTTEYCEALDLSRKDLESLLLGKFNSNNEYASRFENPTHSLSREISLMLKDMETNLYNVRNQMDKFFALWCYETVKKSEMANQKNN